MIPQERIKAEAERFTKDEGYQKVYIAGATAEHNRAQVLVDALEKILKQHDYYSVIELAAKALEQWKSGKGKDEPKPVASNCGMCGKLGKNQYLGNQLYLCNECFEDYEKGKEVGDEM